MRARLLDAAIRHGRGGEDVSSIGGSADEPNFDLEAGLSQFEGVLADRDDLDEEGRSREVERLREDATNEVLLAGFDAAGERAGIPGMEAFLTGLDESFSGSSESEAVSRRMPVQARLLGRLQDRRRQDDVERVRRASDERAVRAERVAKLRSYVLDGEETPADAREVLDTARASETLDAAVLDRLDRDLEGRLSFERERDAALARIDEVIAGGGFGQHGLATGQGIVEGDRPWAEEYPWLDCHFEWWLKKRGAKTAGILKSTSYLPPQPSNPYGGCRHVLTGWPSTPDIVEYARAAAAIPPMLENRIAAQWEAGSDRDRTEALAIADAMRTQVGQAVDAPGLKKALSLVGAGASPDQVVAFRKSSPEVFEQKDSHLADGQIDRPAPTIPDTAETDGVADQRGVAGTNADPTETDEEDERAWIKERRRSAETELAPETLPREDLAKREDETWNQWGRRIYEALDAAREDRPDASLEISRRYFGELYKPENADVVRAMDQKVSLEAYLNPPRDQLIAGAELEAFEAWQRENPGAKPSDYRLNRGHSAFLGADGNYYWHSLETSKRTGSHTALFHDGIEAFDNYAKVRLGDYKHIVLAGLSGGPSFGRGGAGRAAQSFARATRQGQTVRNTKAAKKPTSTLREGGTQEEWEANETQVEKIAGKPVPEKSNEENGVNLQLKYMKKWDQTQRMAADAKCKALCDLDTFVAKSDRSGSSGAKVYKDAGHIVPEGHDVDHIKDLQLGGTTTLDNLATLDASVNRSLGAQIWHQIKDLPQGTIINKVTIE
ncbi:HNH endonuclease [Hwanghaeella grinnelliae]|uniref:HNH endonuclease n=1 Tax=Hwanghaeella grinnelliae TaxID=2500179 RepID=A0A3S2VL80_9PROT|nr:HNH endonuclease signature motif containing protein [Hwanghaeella grinnelliae]RVU34813.1 HNH endonuclease [Hwanghaeella grinnelliae]